MMSKVKAYYWIQRGKEEQVGDYVQRYEKIARECQNAGEEVFSEGMRGLHLIGQAGLSELEGVVVLGAYHIGDGYEKMKNELIWIFGKRRKKEVGWMGGGEDKDRSKLGLKKRLFCVWGGRTLAMEL